MEERLIIKDLDHLYRVVALLKLLAESEANLETEQGIGEVMDILTIAKNELEEITRYLVNINLEEKTKTC